MLTVQHGKQEGTYPAFAITVYAVDKKTLLSFDVHLTTLGALTIVQETLFGKATPLRAPIWRLEHSHIA